MPSRKPEKKKKNAMQRVVLVEDDAILAMALETALLDGGVDEVVVCPSMAATMAELEENRADAIVLDVHLADRSDGWALAELVTMLGERPPRVVFSTGSPEDIPESVRDMGPIFEKPYDPNQLVNVLMSGKKTGIFEKIRGALR